MARISAAAAASEASAGRSRNQHRCTGSVSKAGNRAANTPEAALSPVSEGVQQGVPDPRGALRDAVMWVDWRRRDAPRLERPADPGCFPRRPWREWASLNWGGA